MQGNGKETSNLFFIHSFINMQIASGFLDCKKRKIQKEFSESNF
jgi:hypothetical protein